MKYQTKKIGPREYQALFKKIRAAHPNSDNFGYLGGQIIAITGDFEPTLNLNDARWLYFENGYGYDLVQVNQNGEMIRLREED